MNGEGKSDYKSTVSLQPLSDIHFNADLEGKTDKTTLLSLGLLGVFILLSGAINFINLSTAQASERAKEIGMRKILGSSKRQLIARYLNETVLLTAIAAVFSLLITPRRISSLYRPPVIRPYRQPVAIAASGFERPLPLVSS